MLPAWYVCRDAPPPLLCAMPNGKFGTFAAERPLLVYMVCSSIFVSARCPFGLQGQPKTVAQFLRFRYFCTSSVLILQGHQERDDSTSKSSCAPKLCLNPLWVPEKEFGGHVKLWRLDYLVQEIHSGQIGATSKSCKSYRISGPDEKYAQVRNVRNKRLGIGWPGRVCTRCSSLSQTRRAPRWSETIGFHRETGFAWEEIVTKNTRVDKEHSSRLDPRLKLPLCASWSCGALISGSAAWWRTQKTLCCLRAREHHPACPGMGWCGMGAKERAGKAYLYRSGCCCGKPFLPVLSHWAHSVTHGLFSLQSAKSVIAKRQRLHAKRFTEPSYHTFWQEGVLCPRHSSATSSILPLLTRNRQ